MRSEAIEDYLKAIYRLTEVARTGAAKEVAGHRVGTQELAESLGVAPASVTKMLQRLAGMNLVDLELYRGVRLTEAGEKIALETIRHHRLLESYLHEALGYDWDQVHDEADKLEHYISEDLEARIFEVLGRPAVDPHGEAIPTLSGSMPVATQVALSACETGTFAIVRQLPGAQPEKLRYLKQIGVLPGTEVEVLERYPFGGGMKVRISGRDGEQVIGLELADSVGVEQERSERVG